MTKDYSSNNQRNRGSFSRLKHLFTPIGLLILICVGFPNTARGQTILDSLEMTEVAMQQQTSLVPGFEFYGPVGMAGTSRMANIEVTVYDSTGTLDTTYNASAACDGDYDSSVYLQTYFIGWTPLGVPMVAPIPKKGGFALSYNGTLIQFISVGKTITPSTGVASGETSTQVATWSDMYLHKDTTLQLQGVVPGATSWSGPLKESRCTTNASLALPVTYKEELQARLYSHEDKPQVELTWTTAMEENNYRFEIERSLDGWRFERIGTVDGAGTTFDPITYEYIDEAPYGELMYYRLKQVDFNGRSEYSRTVAVRIPLGEFDNISLKLYPNPVQEMFNLQMETDRPINTIINVNNGITTLRTDEHVWEAGRTEYRMELPSSGIYYVTVSEASSGHVLGSFRVVGTMR